MNRQFKKLIKQLFKIAFLIILAFLAGYAGFISYKKFGTQLLIILPSAIALYGTTMIILLWLTDHLHEREINNKLKKLLIKELEKNKEIIDNNLGLIRGGAGSDIAFEFNTEIFDSIVNSTKIVILDEEYVELLFILYSTIHTVRQIMFSPFRDLVSPKLEEAKNSLENIFDYLEKH